MLVPPFFPLSVYFMSPIKILFNDKYKERYTYHIWIVCWLLHNLTKLPKPLPPWLSLHKALLRIWKSMLRKERFLRESVWKVITDEKKVLDMLEESYIDQIDCTLLNSKVRRNLRCYSLKCNCIGYCELTTIIIC